MKICPVCGLRNDDDNNFCENCGARLNSGDSGTAQAGDTGSTARTGAHSEELIQAVRSLKSGDDDAFGTVYSLTNKIAMNIIRRYCDTPADYEDILQDTYIKVYQSINDLKDDSSAQAWINKIAANTAIRFNMKKKPMMFSEMENDEGQMPDIEDESTEYDPAAVADKNAVSEAVTEVLGMLSEDQRDALWMVYGQKITIREMAQSLGISENTIKSRLHQGSQKLKAHKEEFRKRGIEVMAVPVAVLVSIAFDNSVYAAETAMAAGIGAAVAGAGAAGAAGAAVSNAAGVGATTAENAAVGASVNAAAGTGAASATTVGTAAAATGMSLAAKIGIAAAVAVIGGGAALGVTVYTTEPEDRPAIVNTIVDSIEGILPSSNEGTIDLGEAFELSASGTNGNGTLHMDRNESFYDFYIDKIEFTDSFMKEVNSVTDDEMAEYLSEFLLSSGFPHAVYFDSGHKLAVYLATLECDPDKVFDKLSFLAKLDVRTAENLKVEIDGRFSLVSQEFYRPIDYMEMFMLRGSLDKQDGLSNGDIVTFTWNPDINKEWKGVFNYDFKLTDITYTVSGLK